MSFSLKWNRPIRWRSRQDSLLNRRKLLVGAAFGVALRFWMSLGRHSPTAGRCVAPRCEYWERTYRRRTLSPPARADVFVAIAQEHTLTRAAQRENIAVSGISHERRTRLSFTIKPTLRGATDLNPLLMLVLPGALYRNRYGKANNCRRV